MFLRTKYDCYSLALRPMNIGILVRFQFFAVALHYKKRFSRMQLLCCRIGSVVVVEMFSGLSILGTISLTASQREGYRKGERWKWAVKGGWSLSVESREERRRHPRPGAAVR